MVKAFGEVSCELNVLYLVFANGNLFSPCFDVSEILDAGALRRSLMNKNVSRL
jgi:hypothetical protein